jgi:molybdopterin molybdotransferase
MANECVRATLSVEQAQARVLEAVHALEPELVSLLEAGGRVLYRSVSADHDIPPTANSAMDGYAVRAADITATPAQLTVVGEVAAGHVSDVQVTPDTALRIMTGAPLPAGADSVVRFEETQSAENSVVVLKAPKPGQNVRQAGEDVRAGQVAIRAGTRLRPQEVGMLAALGVLSVSVGRKPRVAILATGDELVPPGQIPGPGQIRDANSFTVAAQVQRWNAAPTLLGVARDRGELIRRGVQQALHANADFIITSGGVSVGDFDLVKQVLAAEGAMHFWSLNMKPGRPLAFGVVGGVPLLGLPGNPVSAMVSTALFARPALLRMQGALDLSWPTVDATLWNEIARKDRRRHYLRVKLTRTDGEVFARLTGDQGSGILNSLVQADGLAVIPEERDHLDAGSRVQVLLLN